MQRYDPTHLNVIHGLHSPGSRLAASQSEPSDDLGPAHRSHRCAYDEDEPVVNGAGLALGFTLLSAIVLLGLYLF